MPNFITFNSLVTEKKDTNYRLARCKSPLKSWLQVRTLFYLLPCFVMCYSILICWCLPGKPISENIVHPYGGKQGTIKIANYQTPIGTSPQKVGWWFSYQSVVIAVPVKCGAMESAFMTFHHAKTQHAKESFLKHVMMPRMQTAFFQVPVALFAHLSPKGGMEGPEILDHFLKIALQRANFFDTTFESLKDIHKKGAVLSFFCSTAANTMPYTMDSVGKNMSEWFGNPRNRRTG